MYFVNLFDDFVFHELSVQALQAQWLNLLLELARVYLSQPVQIYFGLVL